MVLRLFEGSNLIFCVIGIDLVGFFMLERVSCIINKM